MNAAIYGLQFGRSSYEFQHAQDLWFESDACMELLARNDSFKWGGLVIPSEAKDCNFSTRTPYHAPIAPSPEPVIEGKPFIP